MLGSFWAKIDKVEGWHQRLTGKEWLEPLKPTRLVVAIILLSALIATGMNGYVRHWQYQVWQENSQIFYLDDGMPLFTTTDASYFLGLGQAIKQDGNFQIFNKKRSYPVGEKQFEQEPPSSKIRQAPLLSVILSMMANEASTKSMLEAGHRLIPITAILTSLMIILAFGAAGYWIEGSIAAAGGGLSLAYLQRSGAGRIDTDQLNLGFFYLVIALVIWAARVKSYRASLVLAALAGAVFWIFDWWNSRLFFGWAALIGLSWLSLVSQRDIKRTVILALIFGGMSGIFYKGLGFSLNSAYLADDITFDGLIFPNTLSTITEISKAPFSEILTRISGSVWLGMLGVAGLGLWAVRHPALAIVFGPAAAFALLNFLIGNRAIFYSAPMLWFGFGWLLITFFRYGAVNFATPQIKLVAPAIAAMGGFLAVWFSSPTDTVQAPSFDKQIVSDFQKLDKILPKQDVVIASWWDYGYMSMLMNGRPTLHDGGSQTGPSTHFIAQNLVKNSQEEASKSLNILGRYGPQPLIDQARKEAGLKYAIDDKQSAGKTEIYLVLTKDMAKWMPSISKIGAFDIQKGQAVQFDRVKANYQLRYESLKCKATGENQVFICNGDKLDLKTGKLGKQAILDGLVISKDGQQTGGKKFNNANTPFVLQSEMGESGQRNMLMHRALYFSVFHQLFYLNRADPKYFELVYDGFPNMRVFKVL